MKSELAVALAFAVTAPEVTQAAPQPVRPDGIELCVATKPSVPEIIYTCEDRLPNGYKVNSTALYYLGNRLVERASHIREFITKFTNSGILEIASTSDLDVRYTEHGPYKVISKASSETYSATPLD